MRVGPDFKACNKMLRNRTPILRHLIGNNLVDFRRLNFETKSKLIRREFEPPFVILEESLASFEEEEKMQIHIKELSKTDL